MSRLWKHTFLVASNAIQDAGVRLYQADARSGCGDSSSSFSGTDTSGCGSDTRSCSTALGRHKADGKTRTFSGTCRLEGMAVHGHMSSDLKRLVVHNVKLPLAYRALSRQLVYVFVGRVLRGQHIERAGASAGAVMWRCLFKEHEPDTAGRDASLFLQILSHCVTDDTRGSLDSLDLLIQMYATSMGAAVADMRADSTRTCWSKKRFVTSWSGIRSTGDRHWSC